MQAFDWSGGRVRGKERDSTQTQDFPSLTTTWLLVLLFRRAEMISIHGRCRKEASGKFGKLSCNVSLGSAGYKLYRHSYSAATGKCIEAKSRGKFYSRVQDKDGNNTEQGVPLAIKGKSLL